MAVIRTTSPILDPSTGQPIVREVLTEEIAGPTVTGVRQILAEHPSNGLTPARLGAILRDAEQGSPEAYLALAEDLEDKFLHYRAVLSTRKLAVSQLPVTVEAASDAAEDVAAADLVRAAFADDALDGALFDLLDGIGKSFSVSEIVWDTSERQWMPARLVWREPSWFQVDRRDGTTLRLKEVGYPEGRDLDPCKFVIHRPKTKSGLMIRGGLARAAAWPWLFTAFGHKDWVQFAETYGQPIRVGKYGPGASKEDIATLLRAVRNISSDAAAVIPQSMMVEFVQAAGASANADIFSRLVEYFERLVSKLVLGQTTTTDAVSGGHAVSQEHRQVQEDIERADGRQLATTLKRDLVVPLVALNLGPRKAYPNIRIGRPEEEDTKLLIDAVKELVPLGLRVGQSFIRDKLGIEDPGKDEELLGAPATPPAGAGGTDDLTKPEPPATASAKALAAAEGGPIARDDMDRLVEELLADYVELPLDLVERVIQAAKDASGAEDFLARLADLAGGQPLAPLTELLAQGQFSARAAARVGATGTGDAS